MLLLGLTERQHIYECQCRNFISTSFLTCTFACADHVPTMCQPCDHVIELAATCKHSPLCTQLSEITKLYKAGFKREQMFRNIKSHNK